LSIELEKSLQSQRTNLAAILSDVAPFLCVSAIDKVHTCLAEKLEKKEIPSQIRTELIKDLLQKKKCICGRPIDAKSAECTVLMEWLKEVESTQQIGDSALYLYHELSSFSESESKKNALKSANNTLLEYTTTKNKKQKTDENIQTIIEDIGENQNEDITSFGKQLGKIEQDIVRLQAEIINIEKANKDLLDEIDSLKIKIDKEKKEKNIRNLNQDKYDLTENAEKILKSAQNEYIEEIRNIISNETAKNLRVFLDEESQGFFSTIVVDEKYSLQMTDAHGTPFLANISAGQRQLLSLAFITALAQTAAAGNLPEMPLFMDTPFGRLSLEHRQNLIKSIPSLCAQWVLLATDTELRREEAEYLKQTGRLGHFYRLTTCTDNETRIELVETEKAIRQLNSGKEVKA
jgi:DNA sulfur modification protein DndD